jgi:hypothetical protein
MTSATKWYYNAHCKGAFPSQQLLCDTVRWTNCNLEGQKRNPTGLSAIQGNPLTIRLLALDQGFKKFDNFKQIEKKIKKLSREKFKNKQPFMMSGTWEAENSTFNTMGAPIEVVKEGKEELELRHIDIQRALYEFFTNFGSILDRLAYEINLLYALGIKPYYLDWGSLTKKENKYFCSLMGKNQDLANLLTNYAIKLKMATRYRNRLAHDGIIKVEIDISIINSGIMLAEYPDDNNSLMNVDAIRFCENTRIDLLNLLNNSYEIMYQHSKTFGNPPW